MSNMSGIDDNTNAFTNIIKFIVVISCVVGTMVRTIIPESVINVYMAVVNIISFLVSINLLMYECYFQIKMIAHNMDENVIKKDKVAKISMVIYILMFIINAILLYNIYLFYFIKGYEVAMVNDCLGIVSLGFAITSDFISNVIINTIMFFVN